MSIKKSVAGIAVAVVGALFVACSAAAKDVCEYKNTDKTCDTASTRVCVLGVSVDESSGTPKIFVEAKTLHVKGLNKAVALVWVMTTPDTSFDTDGIKFDSSAATQLVLGGGEAVEGVYTIYRFWDRNTVVSTYDYAINLTYKTKTYSCDPTINNQGADGAVTTKRKPKPPRK